MFRLARWLFSIAVLTALLITPALAEKRVALVIGNAKYQHTVELKNPTNDARAVADALKSVGFEVIEGLDLTEIGMQKAVSEFSAKLQTADVGLLYYAGHGLQVDGRNYLVPVDASLDNELQLQFQTISTNLILNVMESGKRISILLLDACRNNPLAEHLSRSLGTRGTTLGRGLAKIEVDTGTYIGYSTQPGNVALDGEGENSPFATALVDNIEKPNVDIELMMRKVRADVIGMTKGYQVPWGNSSLVGGFMFAKLDVAEAKPQPPVTVPAPPTSSQGDNLRTDVEIVFWNSIRDSNDPALLQAYIDKFPNGIFVSIARVLLERLQNAAAARKKAEESATQQSAVLQKQQADEAARLQAARRKADEEARKRAEQIAQIETQRKALEEAAARQKQQADEVAKLQAERQKADEEARKRAEQIAQLETQRKALEEAAAKTKEQLAMQEAAAKAKEQTAMLDKQPDNIVTTPPVPAEPDPALIKSVQQELDRLGCNPGLPDGIWGSGSEKALSSYASNAGIQLAALQPTQKLLEELRAHTQRVCPLVCGPREVARNDRCVLISCPSGQTLAADGSCIVVNKKNSTPRIDTSTASQKLQCGHCKAAIWGSPSDKYYCGEAYLARKARHWCE